jgi:hypothetical protein
MFVHVYVSGLNNYIEYGFVGEKYWTIIWRINGIFNSFFLFKIEKNDY